MSARYVTLRLTEPAPGRTASDLPVADRDALAQAAIEHGLPQPKDLELMSLLARTPFPSAPDPHLYQALATILRQIHAVADDAATPDE